MSLETLLKEACAKGLVHLTLYPVHSQDNKTIYWCARATPSTGHSYVQTQTLDPIEAVTQTLRSLPKAPKRSKSEVAKPVGRDHEPELAVTETVSGHDFGAEPASVEAEEPQPGDMNAWLPKT